MGKAFEKQIKTIEDQGEKQIDALNLSEPKKQLVSVNDNDYEVNYYIQKNKKCLKIFIKNGFLK